jgi:hypothetical protein
MWLMFNNSFVSIVDKATKSGCLMVRARREGDIENIFPGASVQKTPGNDYLFRAEIDRGEIAKRIAEQVMGTEYDNFKDSVRDHKLHAAYNRVWNVMADLQPIPPYGRARRGHGALL